uniref:CAS1 domain-containing protein 1-like n=1 Tax=Saccoglossus kowalevskii TaxID=10224 RepID=A0ABM0M2E0_SACKO
MPENTLVYEAYKLGIKMHDSGTKNWDFIWLPEVNKSANAYYEQLLKIQRLPDILIHGSASWAIKQNSGSPEALEQFKVNLSSLLPIMDKVAEKTNLFWMTQQPVESLKLNEARQVITNEQIEEYNMAVQEILAPSNVKVWKSAAKVSAINDSTEDGLHVKPDLVHTDVQLIINWYCNKQFRPFDGELYCCQPSEEMTPIQQLVFLLFLLSFIYGLNAKVKQWWRNFREYMRPVTPSSPVIKTPAATSSTTAVHNGPLGDVENGSTQPVKVEPAPPPQPSTPSRGEDYSEIAWALGKFGLIMLYFYICDRSGFIPREQKHFTRFRFYLPLCYVTLLGFFFNAKTSQTVILNRDQTDEWKGWMQLVILIYHMSGASAELPIYMHIRILVAMYLFQTGYGHFSFFWSKGDYGFVRFIQ